MIDVQQNCAYPHSDGFLPVETVPAFTMNSDCPKTAFFGCYDC